MNAEKEGLIQKSILEKGERPDFVKIIITFDAGENKLKVISEMIELLT